MQEKSHSLGEIAKVLPTTAALERAISRLVKAERAAMAAPQATRAAAIEELQAARLEYIFAPRP